MCSEFSGKTEVQWMLGWAAADVSSGNSSVYFEQASFSSGIL